MCIRDRREKLHSLPERLFAEMNEELQTEIDNCRIRNINWIDLIFSMISLNVTMFIMMPVIEIVLELDDAQKELMIQHRRTENVDFILKSIRY